MATLSLTDGLRQQPRQRPQPGQRQRPQLRPQPGQRQQPGLRPRYVAQGLDLEMLHAELNEIRAEIRASRDEIMHTLIVTHYGETPGDAADRILAEAA